MNIKVVGIDLAKHYFQVCVLTDENKIHSNKKVTRTRLLDVVRQFPEGTLIAMEACGSSNYWARTFAKMGFEIKLIPPQHVKPFVGHQKNDANDARAICESAFRPDVHGVPTKTIELQDIKSIRCIRQRRVEQRLAAANQLKGLASEYGVIITKSFKCLREQVPIALEDPDNELSIVMRRMLHGLLTEINTLTDEIKSLTLDLEALCKQQPRYQALLAIPGFGPIVTAAFLSQVGSGKQFSNGRQLSAWCGLVPRQFSSGGKTKLGKITKNGNNELRALLIHGARSVSKYTPERTDALSRWFNALALRSGKTKAIVALANKLTRIAWVIVTTNDEFKANCAFKTA